MKHLLSVLLLCVPLLALAAPEVRVQNRLVPDAGVMVGGTVNMEVDLLVDTWFTAAPVLPVLDLPGALVVPPTGEAQHLNEQQDGKAFFGLRFTYQITPQAAQSFTIPALAFQVQPGQGDGPVTVRSQPLNFVAKALAGAQGEHRLVASKVTLSQQIQRSHEPLRVGDSMTRTLTLKAEGAQAMLLPPAQFAEVEGLKRYVQTPKVAALSDGRGGTLGGLREDRVTYVITQPGKLSLPPMQVDWWDAHTGEAHSVAVEQVTFEAGKGAYTAPFSITDDLRALGQNAHVRLSGHGLLLVSVLLLGVALVYLGRPWLQPGAAALRRWRAERRSAWLASPAYAKRLAREQLTAQPPQLGALYLWVRRSGGLLTLAQISEQLPDGAANHSLDLLNIRYSATPSTASPPANLSRTLALLQAHLTKAKVRHSRHGLKPLNP